MTTVITVANIKGGVGKTSTAWMLARHLRRRGHSVLLIDMDPRATLTRLSGVPDRAPTIGQVLGGAIRPTATLRNASQIGKHDIHIVPASIDLANVAHGLHNRMFDRFNALAKAIQATSGDWQYIIVDSPASPDVLTINALAVAQHLVLTSQPEPASIDGLAETRALFGQVYSAMHRTDPWNEHVVITMFDGRCSQHRTGQEIIVNGMSNGSTVHTIPRRNGQDADAALFDAYEPLAEEFLC